MLDVEERFVIRDLYRQGLSISEIARRTRHDRKTVRKMLDEPLQPARRPRRSKRRKIDPYVPYLQQRIDAGVIDDAIDDLEETSEDLVDGYDEMDSDSAQLFKTATRLQTRIERMIEKRNRKAALDEDVSDFDDLIDQFKGNIDKAKNEHKEHKENKGKGKDGNNGNNGKGKGKGKKE